MKAVIFAPQSNYRLTVADDTADSVDPKTAAWTARVAAEVPVYVAMGADDGGDFEADDTGMLVFPGESVLLAVAKNLRLSAIAVDTSGAVSVTEVKFSA